ncbi:hypothetical protein [Thiolapillus sp.]
MHILRRRILAVLLSLMLALAPLQGVFAGDISMPMLGGMDDVSQAAGAGDAPMPAMSQDCGQCKQVDCGGSCDAHHCASCTFAFLLAAPSSIMPPGVATRMWGIDIPIYSCTSFSLFRPPRV